MQNKTYILKEDRRGKAMGQKTTLTLSIVTVSEECTLSWIDKTQFESSSMNAKLSQNRTLCSLEQKSLKAAAQYTRGVSLFGAH